LPSDTPRKEPYSLNELMLDFLRTTSVPIHDTTPLSLHVPIRLQFGRQRKLPCVKLAISGRLAPSINASTHRLALAISARIAAFAFASAGAVVDVVLMTPLAEHVGLFEQGRLTIGPDPGPAAGSPLSCWCALSFITVHRREWRRGRPFR